MTNAIALSSGPEVCPLGKTELDNSILLANLNDLFNMQPSRKLDLCPIHLSEAARLLVILAEVQGPSDRSIESILRTLPSGVMHYLHYSFMVLCDEDLPPVINRNSRLEVINTGTCLLVAGPLAYWYDAITQTTRFSDSHYRLLMNKAQLYFEVTEGLALIFDSYRKMSGRDRTFVLEKK